MAGNNDEQIKQMLEHLSDSDKKQLEKIAEHINNRQPQGGRFVKMKVKQMKYSYYIKDQGKTIDDAKEFESAFDLDDLEFVAQDACRFAWKFFGGWVWLKTGAIITLCVDGKELGDFKIKVEFNTSNRNYQGPVFRAEKVEPK
jgi:hypothetical protein